MIDPVAHEADTRPTEAPREGRTVPLPDRLTWRLADIADLTGLSRRTIERERSAGRFPPPDLKVGKAPLWRPETIRLWIESGGGT